MLPDQDDCAVVTVSTSSFSEHCELDKGSTLSSGSPGANDNLDTSPCTVLAPTSPQPNLLEKDDTFLTLTAEIDDNAGLDVTSEYKPISESELTDLPLSSKELGSDTSILDIDR